MAGVWDLVEGKGDFGLLGIGVYIYCISGRFFKLSCSLVENRVIDG